MSSCGFCGTTEKKLFRCSACESAWYCGAEHQQFDWKRHKIRCKTIQSQKNRVTDGESLGMSIEATSLPTAGLYAGRKHSSGGASSGYWSSTTSAASVGDEPLPSRKRSNSESRPMGMPTAPAEARRNPRFFLPQPSVDEEDADGKMDHSLNAPLQVTPEQHLASLPACFRLNQHEAMVARVRRLARHAEERLNEFGWCVVDHFLGDAHCRAILRDVQTLYARNLFEDGQLMEARPGASTRWIRSDQIFWLDGADERCMDASAVRLLVFMVDAVVGHLKHGLAPYRLCARSKAMIACYPANGTRYVKHVDNPLQDGRCVTSLYYCNAGWKQAHGGVLRLYPESAREAVDVEPRFDRLLFFFSDRRNPHEVLPVYVQRFAITVWYFDEEERRKAQQHDAAVASTPGQLTTIIEADAAITSAMHA